MWLEEPNPVPDIGARVTLEWMGDKAFVIYTRVR